MTLFHRKAAPIVIYSIVWLIAISAFWLTDLSGDAMAYSLLVIYLLLPATTLIMSYLIGRDDRWGKMKWVAPVFFGEMYMLAECFTFSLANMLMNETINAPEFAMVLTGMAISFIAIGLGTFVQTHFRREK